MLSEKDSKIIEILQIIADALGDVDNANLAVFAINVKINELFEIMHKE